MEIFPVLVHVLQKTEEGVRAQEQAVCVQNGGMGRDPPASVCPSVQVGWKHRNSFTGPSVRNY